MTTAITEDRIHSSTPTSIPSTSSSSAAQQAAASVFGHEKDQKSIVHKVDSPLPSSTSFSLGNSSFLSPTLREAIVKDTKDLLINKGKRLAQSNQFHIEYKDRYETYYEHHHSSDIVCNLKPIQVTQTILTSYKLAQEIIQKNQLTHCSVPFVDVEIMKLEDGKEIGLFFFEKSQVMVEQYIRFDESEKEFVQFNETPALKAKWKKMLIQAANFVCLSGYHIQVWTSINWIDDRIIFILPWARSTVSADDVLPSIQRLAQMAPVELMDQILDVARRHFPYVSKNDYRLKIDDKEKQQKASRLDLDKKLRIWHQKKGITSSGLRIDGTSLPVECMLEKNIIQMCNQHILKRSELYDGIVLYERRVCWEAPFKKGIAVEKALSNLVTKGFIFTWLKNDTLYQIYC